MSITADKAKAQQLLLDRMSIKDIVAKYPELATERTLSKWKRELISDKQHLSLDQIANVDTDTISRLAYKVEKEFPATANKLRSVVTGLDSLQRLEPKVHTALEKVIQVAEMALDKAIEDGGNMKLSDLKGYAEIITKMHTSLFNRPNAIVNIQNNSNNPVVQQAVTDKLDGLLKGIVDTDTIEAEVE